MAPYFIRLDEDSTNVKNHRAHAHSRAQCMETIKLLSTELYRPQKTPMCMQIFSPTNIGADLAPA